MRRPSFAFVVLALVLAACGGDETPQAGPTTPFPYDGCIRDGDGTVITMTASDGQQIKGVVLGSGSAGVVLGHQGNKALCSWLGFAHKLADRGYTALAVDFRGYGGSTLKEGSVKQTAADLDIAAAVAELRSRRVQRVAIVGASLGAIGAVIAAANIAPAVQAVVQISGPPACCSMDAGAAIPRLKVPILYIVSTEDAEVFEPIKKMFADTTIKAKKLAVYEGFDHGTDIFDGEHASQLESDILAWLDKYVPAA